MADDLTTATDPPDLQALVDAVMSGVKDPVFLDKLQMGASNFLTDGFQKVFFVFALALSKLVGPMVAGIAEGTIEGTDSLKGAAAHIAGKLFGVSLGAGDVGNGVGSGGGIASIADVVMKGLGGDGSALAPSDAAAKRFLEMALHIAIDGWAQGFILEAMGEAETVGILKLDKVGELSETMIRALGLGRLTRSVLRPLAHATIVTPFTWQVNKTYRPKLLTHIELARDIARGRRTQADALEELARQGWSDDRAESLLTSARKTLSAAEVLQLAAGGNMDDSVVRGYLKDLGYDDEATNNIITLKDDAEHKAVLNGSLTELADAWIAGAIDDADFQPYVASVFPNEALRAMYGDLLALKKKARTKRLTRAEVETAVQRGILSIEDYNNYLELENYDEQAKLVLPLLLESLVNSKETAATAKAQKAAAATLKAQVTATAKAAKAAALLAGTATTAPELAAIRRAFVDGLTPIGTYTAALDARHYPSADVALLVELAQQDRETYVAAEQKRAAAVQRAAAKHLSLGSLDQAVLAHLLSVAEYGQQLAAAGFTPDEIGILQGLIQHKLDSATAAAATKAAAVKALGAKGLSLAEEEKAVKAGTQTIADYTAFLTAHEFNAGDVATLTATLQAEIAKTKAAKTTAAAANAAPGGKGIALSQLEAAVVAGVRPIGEYQQLLVDQGYSALDVSTLVELLQAKADTAAAARAKHATVAGATSGRVLSLTQVERAVTLGTVTMTAYESYLSSLGYSAADVGILVDNLTATIQTSKLAQQKRATVLATLRANGIDLAPIEAGVLDGSRNIAEYSAALVAGGVAAADVTAITNLLQDQLTATADAQQLAATVAPASKPKALTLAQWEAAVVGGTRTIADFGAYLTGAGYTDADAQVLMTLVAEKLPAS